jgi:hypothetical protein
MIMDVILNNQPRRFGKTTEMIVHVIAYASLNPEQQILLCLTDDIPNEIVFPSNVKVLKTQNMETVAGHFIGSAYTLVEIDHHLKDITLLKQAEIIDQLNKKIADYDRRFKKIAEFLP